MRPLYFFLLTVAFVVLTVSGAQAQNVGAIMLYFDEPGTICEFIGDPSLFVSIYYFHEFHDGVTGSQFALLFRGPNWNYIATMSSQDVLVIGSNPQNGFAWAYNACETGKFYFGNTLYSVLGPSTSCASIEVVPSPAALGGIIEGIDCNPTKYVADSSILTMNDPVTDCDCGRVVPVLPTTWGKVKALYK